MILLKATNESLTITTTTAANIDYSVSYADLTGTTFAPSTNEGNMASGTATLLAAPSSGVQRQIKLITITNRHATLANTVLVKKLITATDYYLAPVTTLLAGEVMEYVDSRGWVCYTVSGTVKEVISAGGANNQILYNSGGLLTGDARLTYDPTANDLAFSGTDPNIIVKTITNEPEAPPPNQLAFYTKTVSGRVMPKWRSPSGVDTSFQSIIAFNTVWTWTPATTTNGVGWGFGCTWPTCTGTITHPTVAANLANSMKVMQCTNVATTANQILGLTASTATLANVWRGNGAGLGGFFFQCRFKIVLIPATTIRIFVGLTSLATGMVASDSPTGDFCGFDHITTDNITTMSFTTRNNVTTTRSTFTVPTLAAGNSYDATIYSQPNGSAIYYRLVNLLTGLAIIDTDTSVTGNTTLPRSNIFMGPQAQMSNAANGTVTTTAIGINKIYLECDM